MGKQLDKYSSSMATTPFSATVTTIFLFFFLAVVVSSACNEHDLAALGAIADSVPYTNLALFWTNATDCCSWDYLGCDGKTGRVTSLSFLGDSDDPPSVNFNGPIPASIGDLSALESLTVAFMPNLTGPLPIQLSKLKRLRVLSVHDSQISGPIPSFISQFPALNQLDLYNNKLSGAVPSSLGDLVKLNHISLYGNRLTGAIPASLFSRLAAGSTATLDLSNNRLTGTVPRSFANVPFLYLYLWNNRLTGDASFLFGKSKPLEDIMLVRNMFEFDLTNVEYPENLVYLDISHNKNIYGSISNQVTELAKLDTFIVSYNNLCGKIPTGRNLDKFPASFYERNKCLCGSPLPACK